MHISDEQIIQDIFKQIRMAKSKKKNFVTVYINDDIDYSFVSIIKSYGYKVNPYLDFCEGCNNYTMKISWKK